jgi:quercetin dioxygenase-like cupin family protein
MTESIAPVTGSVISDPDVQAAIWFLGALSQVRVSGAQTGGAFALADHLAPRGNASPVHVHDRDDETFFVLDGELRVFVGEEEHAAGPGTVAVLPRRLRHAYVVTSATARFLTLHTPRRVRAVRHRGWSTRPGPHPAPATCRTAGLRRAGPCRRPVRHHHPGPAAPALEGLRSSMAVTAAPASPPQPTITNAVRGEVASSTGPPRR